MNQTTKTTINSTALSFTKRLKLLLFVLFFLVQHDLQAQMKRIAVIGSSTAAGYGLPGYISGNNNSAPDSWVNKLKKYYKDAGRLDTLYNFSQASTDCYTGMPTGFVPPAGRNAPNPNLNITKVLGCIPKPDVLIVNYPTNSYDWLTISEVMKCLRTIKNLANTQGIACFITTTQPRTSFSFDERQKLAMLRDSIMIEFGMYALDFWTDLVKLPDLTIRPEFSLGDDVHLSVDGHHTLYMKVLQQNIFTAAAPLPVKFKYVTPKRIDENTLELTFEMAETEGVENYFLNITVDGVKKRVELKLPEKPIANKRYTVNVKIN